MILCDTDHLTVLQLVAGSSRRDRLLARMALQPAGTRFAAPIVSVEEQMRGWLACIAKERKAARQVEAYESLTSLFAFFAAFKIAPFDSLAAKQFDEFNRIRISTSDRKIGAIALVHDALLLTANRRDFEKIPGLRFENWLD
jgi:tRNA(fMet)-specific endonuclease VapC